MNSHTVYTLEEAADWFLENHSETLICDDGERIQIVNSFQEAKDFFGVE